MKFSGISPSLGLRFTGVQESHNFKSHLNIPSRITQSFSQILVISGRDEEKGEDGQAWDFRPVSLHKALYTQQWHQHSVVKSTTKIELFNAFLSVPIRDGQSTEKEVFGKAGEIPLGWISPIKISLPVTWICRDHNSHRECSRDVQCWRHFHVIKQHDRLNRTGSLHFGNAPSRKYYLNQIKPSVCGVKMKLTDSHRL